MYLHGKTKSLIFSHLPEGWNEFMGDSLGKDNDLVILNKTLYGAPHAGCQWNKVINLFLIELKFTTSPSEPSLYFNKTFDTIIVLYVNNLFINGPNLKHIKSTMLSLKTCFKIRDEGLVKYVLGIRFNYILNGSIFLTQESYLNEIVSLFRQVRHQTTPLPPGIRATTNDCPSSNNEKADQLNYPYHQILGKLLYLALGTCPNIMFAVSSLARFANNHGKQHWTLLTKIVE